MYVNSTSGGKGNPLRQTVVSPQTSASQPSDDERIPFNYQNIDAVVASTSLASASRSASNPALLLEPASVTSTHTGAVARNVVAGPSSLRAAFEAENLWPGAITMATFEAFARNYDFSSDSVVRICDLVSPSVSTTDIIFFRAILALTQNKKELFPKDIVCNLRADLTSEEVEKDTYGKQLCVDFFEKRTESSRRIGFEKCIAICKEKRVNDSENLWSRATRLMLAYTDFRTIKFNLVAQTAAERNIGRHFPDDSEKTFLLGVIKPLYHHFHDRSYHYTRMEYAKKLRFSLAERYNIAVDQLLNDAVKDQSIDVMNIFKWDQERAALSELIIRLQKATYGDKFASVERMPLEDMTEKDFLQSVFEIKKNRSMEDNVSETA